MKIALLNDTHFGARNDSVLFNDYFFKFYDNVFFPHIEKHNIKTLVHLGDLVDRRKFVNYVILDRVHKDFIGRLEGMNIDQHYIVGNHDLPMKQLTSINAIKELFFGYNKLAVYDQPVTKEFDGIPICFIPWICDETRINTFLEIKNTKAEIVMGHLELNGFEFEQGMVFLEGMDKNVFSKFDIVMSGHFHHKSSDGQIFYLGNQYQIYWSDYNEERGFHIFDTDTRELEFIKNPYNIFFKLVYDDSNKNFAEEMKKIDFSKYKDSYVKILVINKSNPFLFDTYIRKLYEAGPPADVSILEAGAELNMFDSDDLVSGAMDDTPTTINRYIDNLDTSLDKNKLKNITRELYTEAINLENT